LLLSATDVRAARGDARVVATVRRPRLAVLAGVVSTTECEVLMSEASRMMRRSEVIGADNAATVSDGSRTSSGMYFESGVSPTAEAVQRRLMALMDLPVSHGEPLQVLRYGPGEVYESHFDYFDPDAGDQATSTIALYGQRIATMICYLSEVADGGTTTFPAVGLDVRPHPGAAVYFTYVDDHGQLDEASLHGGAPVAAGEKWILTQWCRSHPYRRA
jgi:prolyl 4-hydroxylase